MQPEQVGLCPYCIKLISSHSAKDELQHWPTLAHLRPSSNECAICKILLGCFDERRKNAMDRFKQIEMSTAEQCPLSLELIDNTTNTDSEVHHKSVVAGIEFPNKFTYVWSFHIATRERSASAPMSPAWTYFPTSLEQKVSQIQDWLRVCENSHSKCRPKWQCQLPRRLVDLGIGNERTLKLVDTASLNSSEIKYTTLSYCWGGSSSQKTTKELVSAYYDNIPHSELPKTFLDAMHVTKELGLRYIWIDALCIIQDDQDDWNTESSKMDEIYHGSHLTVSANDARSVSGGVFVQTSPSLATRTTHARAFLSWVSPEDTKETLIHLVPEFGGSSALHERGWTLQESVLSPRNVYVTNSELKWSCECGSIWESSAQYQYRQAENLHEDLASLEADDHVEKRNRVWEKLMKNYSNRRFTLPQDRLPAMLGLINYYQRVTQDIPVLGLWKSSLEEGLGWMRISIRSERSPEALADQNLPSWSPLSCDQAVDYAFWDARNKFDEPGESCVDVINFELSWTGMPYLSKVQSSSLLVSAPLQEILLSEVTELPDCNPPYFNVDDEGIEATIDNPLPWRCAVQWDTEGFRSPKKWTCLLLRRKVTKGWELGGETFLVLEPLAAGTYRRIGIGSMGRRRFPNEEPEQEWKFDHTVRSRITLV